jgi:hypothetical protein
VVSKLEVLAAAEKAEDVKKRAVDLVKDMRDGGGSLSVQLCTWKKAKLAEAGAGAGAGGTASKKQRKK